MQRYPTKEQILAEEMLISDIEISTLTKWKRTVWSKVRKESDEKKVEALIKLISRMGKIYKLKLKTQYDVAIPTAFYNPLHATIILNNTSIITTLHELGHAIFGPSELKACAFSVQLFKEVFPEAYKKLKWDKHMLKR